MNFKTNGSINEIKDDEYDVSYQTEDDEDEELSDAEFNGQPNVNDDVNEEADYMNHDIPLEEEDDSYYTSYQTEDDDDDDSFERKGSNPELKYKMIRYGVIAVVILVVVLLFLFILSFFRGISPKSTNYVELESTMRDAAVAYFNDHKDLLPDKDNQIVEVDVENLVAGGYMKKMSNYTKEKCTGSVQVKKDTSSYEYTPMLACDNYRAKSTLAETLKANNKVVTSNYGLYDINGALVFRGENVNNYVKLDNSVWRVLKINNDNTVVLVSENSVGYSTSYDDRYNEKTGMNTGINDYKMSRIREKLQSFYDTTEESNYTVFTSNDKAKFTSFNTCISPRALNDSSKNNSTECKSTVTDKVGLLTVSDYMMASIDKGCNSTVSEACQNYNYLYSGYAFWLSTPSTTSTDTAYVVDGGVVRESKTLLYYGTKITVTLKSTVGVTGGTGTYDEPYTLK